MNINTKNPQVSLRSITATDLPTMWAQSYGPDADLEWRNWNGPYFNDPLLTWDEFRQGWGKTITENPHAMAILYQGEIVGEINAHYEDGDLKQWLEIGMVIYQQKYWNSGIGTAALEAWLVYLFQLHPDLPHIGYTTWSGNHRMMKLGEKLGMTKEAQIRKVRFWQGEYYDSVKYGILREELQG